MIFCVFISIIQRHPCDILEFLDPVKKQIYYFYHNFFNLFKILVIAIFFSKEMRRTFKGIVKSVKHMVDLLIFYLLLMLVWALIGYLIINNLDHSVEYEEVSMIYWNSKIKKFKVFIWI